MTEKYTTKSDNHYVQAAWLGEFWGIDKSKKPRDRNLHSISLSSIFKKYDDFPTFETLIENNIINNKNTPSNLFKSNNLLLDEIDKDFAYKCEGFLQAIKQIENKVIKSIEQEPEGKIVYVDNNLFEQFKYYICLHLARNKMDVVKTFLYVNNLIINNHSGAKINFPLNFSEEEINYLNNNFSTLTESNIKEFKKIITYHYIRDNYDYFIKEMKEYTHVSYLFVKDEAKNMLASKYYLTEMPFFSGKYLKSMENNALDEFMSEFISFLQAKYHENYQVNEDLKITVRKTFENVIIGTLTDKIIICLFKESSKMNEIFREWIMSYNFIDNIYLNSSLGTFVFKSFEDIELFYTELKQYDFNKLKNNFEKVDNILSKANNLKELISKRKTYNNSPYIIKNFSFKWNILKG